MPRLAEKKVWLLGLVIMAAIGVFGFLRSPFFNLQQIVIEGNSLVAKQEVLALANVGLGTNMFQIPTSAIKKNILLHPLIKQVDISTVFPSTLVIKVVERRPAAMIPVLNGFVMVDEQGLFLQRSDTWPRDSLPVISGVQLPASLDLGHQIPAAGLLEGIKLLRSLPVDLQPLIGELNCANRDKLIMYTKDGLEIRLGSSERATEKFSVLQQFLTDKNYNSYRQGFYIDVSSGKPVLGDAKINLGY